MPDMPNDQNTPAVNETVPDSPGGYHFRYIPGRDVDVSTDRAIREVAHANGLPPSLAAHVHRAYLTANDKPRPDPVTIELQSRSTEAKLRARWGADYDTRMALAKSAFANVPVAHRATVDRILNNLNVGSNRHLIERLAFFGEQKEIKK